jgi:hypothetical protein
MGLVLVAGCSSHTLSSPSGSTYVAQPQEEVLGPVAGHESVGPKSSRCTAPEIVSSDGSQISAVTLGTGQGIVYFTTGGRSEGLPVTVQICPVTEGADRLAQGYTVRNNFNPATNDSSAQTVEFGPYKYSMQTDKDGGFIYRGFANGQYVMASAGGRAPAAEAQGIVRTVLSRIR